MVSPVDGAESTDPIIYLVGLYTCTQSALPEDKGPLHGPLYSPLVSRLLTLEGLWLALAVGSREQYLACRSERLKVMMEVMTGYRLWDIRWAI